VNYFLLFSHHNLPRINENRKEERDRVSNQWLLALAYQVKVSRAAGGL
jgi:hypothetical protein